MLKEYPDSYNPVSRQAVKDSMKALMPTLNTSSNSNRLNNKDLLLRGTQNNNFGLDAGIEMQRVLTPSRRTQIIDNPLATPSLDKVHQDSKHHDGLNHSLAVVVAFECPGEANTPVVDASAKAVTSDRHSVATTLDNVTSTNDDSISAEKIGTISVNISEPFSKKECSSSASVRSVARNGIIIEELETRLSSDGSLTKVNKVCDDAPVDEVARSPRSALSIIN